MKTYMKPETCLYGATVKNHILAGSLDSLHNQQGNTEPGYEGGYSKGLKNGLWSTDEE